MVDVKHNTNCKVLVVENPFYKNYPYYMYSGELTFRELAFEGHVESLCEYKNF